MTRTEWWRWEFIVNVEFFADFAAQGTFEAWCHDEVKSSLLEQGGEGWPTIEIWRVRPFDDGRDGFFRLVLQGHSTRRIG